MSFILDALKKSEAERQPQSTAEFTAATSTTAKSGFPTWLWLVGLLLLINLAVLAGLLLRSENQPEAAAANAAMAVVTDDTVDTVDKSFSDQLAEARRKIPVQQADNSRTPSTLPTEQRATRVAPKLISQSPESVDMQHQYPTIQELRAGGGITIPDLHLDIHVYSEAPADRFVFINMSKHHEGSLLGEGPQIKEITPLGVVLTYAGDTFLLPRE